jgi:TRAP-type C4-dicarboxylate transport system substrate-binding protein
MRTKQAFSRLLLVLHDTVRPKSRGLLERKYSFRMMLVLSALCAGLAAPARAEVVLRLGTYINKSDVRYKEGLEKFAALVDKYTAGRVRVELYGSGTLHPFDKSYQAVRAGISDISPFVLGSIPKAKLPCAAATQVWPMAVDWTRHIELDQKYNELLAPEFAKAGLVIVYSSNASYDQEWFFDRPVPRLHDLNGLLVRTPGQVITETIKGFGGKPVFIAPTEVYASAERGVVNGINMGVATFTSWKLWGVMPYMIHSHMYYNNILYAMNREKFESLSKDDQKALLKAGLETEQHLGPIYTAWIDEQIGNAVMTKGVSVRTISKEERDQAIAKARQAWDSDLGKACGKPVAEKLQALFKEYSE